MKKKGSWKIILSKQTSAAWWKFIKNQNMLALRWLCIQRGKLYCHNKLALHDKSVLKTWNFGTDMVVHSEWQIILFKQTSAAWLKFIKN